ncbi:poly-gamma-glutamate hydrolase family protein [Streptomyces sp. BI20]|uniref:poly-gamma-glutamate hydrolase family protein n=1 Tax=Streptomyces sp. BI20 TaxID=3403460 RepID=UPI003C77AD61
MNIFEQPSVPSARRRTVLTAALGVSAVTATGTASAAVAAPAPAPAVRADVEYPSNTALYRDPSVVEGTDYGRRHRRHAHADGSFAPVAGPSFGRTVILALHGGGIEMGTSELCLGIAGYDPADPAKVLLDGALYDHWLFEGLRGSDNKALHVTSRNCDDQVARSLAAGAQSTLSLHGCTAAQVGLTGTGADPAAVVVGGRDALARAEVLRELRAAGFQAIDAFDPVWFERLRQLNGDHVDNICNGTLLGGGVQLEITTELRRSLFDDFGSRGGRARSWNARFRAFRDACRNGIARAEAARPIL